MDISIDKVTGIIFSQFEKTLSRAFNACPCAGPKARTKWCDQCKFWDLVTNRATKKRRQIGGWFVRKYMKQIKEAHHAIYKDIDKEYEKAIKLFKDNILEVDDPEKQEEIDAFLEKEDVDIDLVKMLAKRNKKKYVRKENPDERFDYLDGINELFN